MNFQSTKALMEKKLLLIQLQKEVDVLTKEIAKQKEVDELRKNRNNS